MNSGAFSGIGVVAIDHLGRASVAVLSLISGWLIYASSERRKFALLKSRFLALYVPMVAWNLITLCLAAIALLFGIQTSIAGHLADMSGVGLLNALTGLTGPTLNNSLFFLRDLFVASAIIVLAKALIVRLPMVSLLVVTICFFGELLEPLVFRESILLFLLSGFLLRHYSVSLTQLSATDMALPAFAVTAALYVLVLQLRADGLWSETASAQVIELFKRSGLVFLLLLVSALLVRRNLARGLVRFTPYVYPAFLCHMVIFAIAYHTLLRVGLDPESPAYLVFFLLAPALAMLCGWAMTLASARYVPVVCVIMHGKLPLLPNRAARQST